MLGSVFLFKNFMTNSGLLFISWITNGGKYGCRWRMWCNRRWTLLFFQNGSSELKNEKTWFGANWLKTFMNTASKRSCLF
jgi:hypothetical protein